MPGRGRWRRFQTLFARRIWSHASSWADIKFIALNTVLSMFVFTGSLLSATTIAAGVSLLLRYIFQGRPAPMDLTLASLLFSLALFIADDFARFYLHYWQHRLPGLWVFHKTHHSAEVLTPLTLLRTHPVEIVAARPF